MPICVCVVQDLQLMFNFICNDHMDFYDGTCCKKPRPVTVPQALVLSLTASRCVVTHR